MEKNLLLKAARVRKGMTQSDVASLIEKTVDNYSKKERGEVYFFPAEIAKITNALELTFDEFNAIFFNSQLQFCNK